VAKVLAQMPEIRKCQSIGGEIDMILQVEAQDSLQLNDIRNKVEAVRGVRKVTTGIILTERFDRT
jgi:DNA-binding Lrp family transcriptional regulator